MGMIYTAHCGGCGYESESLFHGTGMIPGTGYALAQCDHCRAIVSVSLGKRLRCPKCRRKPVLIPVPDDDEDTDEELLVKCPKCGADGCGLFDSGMWD